MPTVATSAPAEDSNTSDLPKIHDIIKHQVFGDGLVTAIYDIGGLIFVDIDFCASFGKKTFCWEFAKKNMRIVEQEDYIF